VGDERQLPGNGCGGDPEVAEVLLLVQRGGPGRGTRGGAGRTPRWCGRRRAGRGSGAGGVRRLRAGVRPSWLRSRRTGPRHGLLRDGDPAADDVLAVDRHERGLGSEPGKTDGYHRLHRGGDRQSNSALWTIVLSGMATHPETRAYVERRTKASGKRRAPILLPIGTHSVRRPARREEAKKDGLDAAQVRATHRKVRL